MKDKYKQIKNILNKYEKAECSEEESRLMNPIMDYLLECKFSYTPKYQNIYEGVEDYFNYRNKLTEEQRLNLVRVLSELLEEAEKTTINNNTFIFPRIEPKPISPFWGTYTSAHKLNWGMDMSNEKDKGILNLSIVA